MVSSVGFGEAHAKLFAEKMGGKGKYVVYVGSLTVPAHNAWADAAIAYLKKNYPDMQMVGDRYGVAESADDSRKTALDVLAANPDLGGFLTFGSQGPIGAGRAIDEQQLGDKVVAGRIVLARARAARMLKSGIIDGGYMWNPHGSRQGVRHASADYLAGGGKITDGMTIEGLGVVHPDFKNGNIIVDAVAADHGRHGRWPCGAGALERRSRLARRDGVVQPGVSRLPRMPKAPCDEHCRGTRRKTLTPVLSLRNISVTFGGVKALQDVGFEVLPGEVQCIAGENGSGKSTLIKVITGVYQPLAGAQHPVRRQVRRHNVARRGARRRRRGHLAGSGTVSRNDGRREHRHPNGARQRAAAGRSFGHARDRAQASGAARRRPRRRCAAAHASPSPSARSSPSPGRWSGDARIIFMDEPTSSLTQSETDRLLAIVRTLSAEGIAVVFVSHRLAEVLEISSRVTVLRDGKLVGVYPTAGMTQSRLTELMTGKTFDQSVRARDHAAIPVVLRVDGLTRAGDYEDVSLTIRRGETSA